MHVERLAGLTVVYSNSTLIEVLVLGAAFGLLGYYLSERYKRIRGVTPWRMPSGVWAALMFLFSLIGMVVYMIACLTTRTRTGPTGWAGGAQHWEPGPREFRGPPPQGWEAPPPPGTGFPGLMTPTVPGAVPAAALPVPPPPPPRSWLPDPAGRHELRYWDGTRFTEHVADAGKISVDPL
ncbi:MAG: DUF2510 domain-containing protein [Acidimicrobiales bacterium]